MTVVIKRALTSNVDETPTYRLTAGATIRCGDIICVDENEIAVPKPNISENEVPICVALEDIFTGDIIIASSSKLDLIGQLDKTHNATA